MGTIDFEWIKVVILILGAGTSFFAQYIISTECDKKYKLIMPIVGVICIILKFAFDIYKLELEAVGYYIICASIVIVYCFIGIWSEYKARKKFEN